MITIVKACQTSMACPSQSDAWDAAGRYYYLRYRHGLGAVESAESREAWHETWRNAHWDEQTQSWTGFEPITVVATFEHGDEHDGHISLEEFAQHAGITLADDLERVAYWRHTADRLTAAFKDDPAALARADQLLGGIDLDQENIASTTDTVDEAP